MDKCIKSKLKLKRGNTSDWLSCTEPLEQGEPGYNTATGILKVGDGTSLWESLDPVGNIRLNYLGDFTQGSYSINPRSKGIIVSVVLDVYSGMGIYAFQTAIAMHGYTGAETYDYLGFSLGDLASKGLISQGTADECYFKWDGFSGDRYECLHNPFLGLSCSGTAHADADGVIKVRVWELLFSDSTL